MKRKDKLLETLESLDTPIGNMVLDVNKIHQAVELIRGIGDKKLRNDINEAISKIFEKWGDKEFDENDVNVGVGE